MTCICLNRFNIPNFKPERFFPKRQIPIVSPVLATLLFMFGERKFNVFKGFSIEYFKGLGRAPLTQK